MMRSLGMQTLHRLHNRVLDQPEHACVAGIDDKGLQCVMDQCRKKAADAGPQPNSTDEYLRDAARELKRRNVRPAPPPPPPAPRVLADELSARPRPPQQCLRMELKDETNLDTTASRRANPKPRKKAAEQRERVQAEPSHQRQAAPLSSWSDPEFGSSQFSKGTELKHSKLQQRKNTRLASSTEVSTNNV